MVVSGSQTGFSADYGFRLLFALFPGGKSTKKLMKMRAANLLIFSTEIMCKSRVKLANLLRIS